MTEQERRESPEGRMIARHGRDVDMSQPGRMAEYRSFEAQDRGGYVVSGDRAIIDRGGRVARGRRGEDGVDRVGSTWETRDEFQERIAREQESAERAWRTIHDIGAASRAEEAERNARRGADMHAQMVNASLERAYERSLGGRGRGGARRSERLRREAEQGWISDTASRVMQDVAVNRIRNMAPEGWVSSGPDAVAMAEEAVRALESNLVLSDPEGAERFRDAAASFQASRQANIELDDLHGELHPSTLGVSPEDYEQFASEISAAASGSPLRSAADVAEMFGLEANDVRDYARRVRGVAERRRDLIRQSNETSREDLERIAEEVGVDPRLAYQQFVSGELDEAISTHRTAQEALEGGARERVKEAIQEKRKSMLEDWHSGRHLPMTEQDRNQIMSRPGGFRYMQEYDQGLEQVMRFAMEDVAELAAKASTGEEAIVSDEVIMRWMSHPAFMPSMIGDLKSMSMLELSEARR